MKSTFSVLILGALDGIFFNEVTAFLFEALIGLAGTGISTFTTFLSTFLGIGLEPPMGFSTFLTADLEADLVAGFGLLDLGVWVLDLIGTHSGSFSGTFSVISGTVSGSLAGSGSTLSSLGLWAFSAKRN